MLQQWHLNSNSSFLKRKYNITYLNIDKDMRLNLSSQIVLNKVPVEFYKPKTTVEYSEISRMEKIHTDIFASMAEGASHVADKIEAGIKAAQQEGKFYQPVEGAFP